jgi:cephalosporin-C deacetylase-like acetyl esterase
MKRWTVAAMLLLALAAKGVAQTTAPDGSRATMRGAARGGASAPALQVTADHADWNYLPGEPVTFTISAAPGTAISYTIGLEMMPADAKSAVIPASGKLVLDGGTLKEPGFLRCVATAQPAGPPAGGGGGTRGGGRGGGRARGLATAAFSPEKIRPTQVEPADFDAFWDRAKAELAKLPLDAQLTPLPAIANEKVEAYQVSLQNIGATPGTTSRFYGILCIPRGQGPFPAMMIPPGAGVRGPGTETTWAERGFMVLNVGIHEMPVIPTEESKARPPVPGNYATMGLEDPERFYFRRVFMGCLRANDFLTSHPKWDHKRLVGLGGSQGGFLTIVTAALDPRETACVVSFPAFCDVTGYLHGRAGGWPKILFDDPNDPQRAAKIRTTGYFDAVNFAKRIKIPGHYGWGYNDETCPPDSTFSAYNVITAPRELTIIKEMGHPRVPALTAAEREWLLKQVGMTPP